MTAALIGTATSAQARDHAQRTQREPEVAHCLAKAAGGIGWLETILWGLRDQEGGWVGARQPNTNGTFDLGVMQINTWWIPKIASVVGRTRDEVERLLRFDPCFNAETARWIFQQEFRTEGDFWRAVGRYHSPTRWRQVRYAGGVVRHLRRRFGENVFAQSAPSPAHGKTRTVSTTMMPIVFADVAKRAVHNARLTPGFASMDGDTATLAPPSSVPTMATAGLLSVTAQAAPSRILGFGEVTREPIGRRDEVSSMTQQQTTISADGEEGKGNGGIKRRLEDDVG